MKRAADSLLTFSQIPFSKSSNVPSVPRDKGGTRGWQLTPFTPFTLRRYVASSPDLSVSPRSFVCSRLGEGRIRSLFRGTYVVLVVVAVLFLQTENLLSAAGAIIELKREAAVASGDVRLQDVADVRGEDSRRINDLASVKIGTSPDFGSVAIMTRHEIRKVVAAAGQSLENVSFEGAPAVQLRQIGQAPDHVRIADLLKEHLAKTTQWRASEIEVRSIGNLNRIEFPPGELELRLSSDATFTGRNRVLASLEAIREGKILRSFWITAELTVRAPIVTASRAIARDEVVESDDISTTLRLVPDLRASYTRSDEDLVGQAARRGFSAGEPLVLEAFTRPPLIRSGDRVKLLLERDGVVLSSIARAEQDGVLGQIIQVRNLTFSKKMKAQVTGPAEVRIE